MITKFEKWEAALGPTPLAAAGSFLPCLDAARVGHLARVCLPQDAEWLRQVWVARGCERLQQTNTPDNIEPDMNYAQENDCSVG